MVTFVDYMAELRARILPAIEPVVQKLSDAKQRELRCGLQLRQLERPDQSPSCH
jgi:hypothetical protein